MSLYVIYVVYRSVSYTRGVLRIGSFSSRLVLISLIKAPLTLMPLSIRLLSVIVVAIVRPYSSVRPLSYVFDVGRYNY